MKLTLEDSFSLYADKRHPEWISNGHWLALRKFVDNTEELEEEPIKFANSFEMVGESKTPCEPFPEERWKAWMLDVVRMGTSGPKSSFIQRQYYEPFAGYRFAFSAKKQQGEHPVVVMDPQSGERVAIIMPVRSSDVRAAPPSGG